MAVLGTRVTRATTCRVWARVLLARERDAADVALSTTFGPNTLTSFKVWAEACAEGGA